MINFNCLTRFPNLLHVWRASEEAAIELWGDCVSERVRACPCVGAVAKGMPWLRGASQTADGFPLEVAAPLSFICADRPRRCLPVQLTGRDSWGAGTAGACDSWEALPIDPSAWCVFKWGKKEAVREAGWMEGWSGSAGGYELYMDPICSQGSLGSMLPQTSDSTHRPPSQTHTNCKPE